MKWYYIFGIVAIIYTVFTWSDEHYEEYDKCSGNSCLVYVSRVIDGDTFVTDSGLRVRINGYNAPELDSPGGYEAKACLVNNIQGKNIRIILQGRDYYKRQLATVTSHRVTC